MSRMRCWLGMVVLCCAPAIGGGKVLAEPPKRRKDGYERHIL